MNSKESGLTVGELTMTIAAIIIAALIWSSFDKKQDSNKSLNNNQTYSIIYSKYT